MNKQECKKYLKRAFNRLKEQNKSLTIENFKIEMQKEIDAESEIYIAYSKMALYTLLNSDTDINVKQLLAEIDAIIQIYSEYEIILKSNNIP